MKTLKNISGLFYLSLVALLLSFSSCDKDDDEPNNVLKFDSNNIEVIAGKTAIINVKNGTAPYTAASSDTKVATVKVDKSKITITGVKKGKVTVNVTDKNNDKGQVTITVKEASGLSFDKKSVTISVDKEESITINGGVAPYAATSKDSKIATATVKEGKVTVKGIKVGTTTITVTDKDKKNSGTISVTVK